MRGTWRAIYLFCLLGLFFWYGVGFVFATRDRAAALDPGRVVLRARSFCGRCRAGECSTTPHPALKKVGVQSTTPLHSFCTFLDNLFARPQPTRSFRLHPASIGIFSYSIASTTSLSTFILRPLRQKLYGGGEMDEPRLCVVKHFLYLCLLTLLATTKSSSHHGKSRLAGPPTSRTSVSVRACR